MQKWKHAVNTRTLLNQVLSSDKYNCIEADVTWNNIFNKPVMKHESVSSSSYSDEFLFENFIKIILNSDWLYKNGKKIVKLDFKNINCVNSCIEYIKQCRLHNIENNLNIWLNADILKGPGNSHSQPLNATKFINDCEKLNNATLSVGWTTSFSILERTSELYTKEMIAEMLKLTENLDMNVTFPLRASLVRQSWNNVTKLINENRSITVWTGAEGVPQCDLDWMKQRGITQFDVEKGCKDDWLSWKRVLYYVEKI